MSTAIRRATATMRRVRGRSRTPGGKGWLEAVFKTAILLYLATAVVLAFRTHGQYTEAIAQVRANPWGLTLVTAAQIMLGLFVIALLWRFILVLRYRPAPPCPDEQLPTCTVIVPAYNEGRDVLGTLRSIVRSDFPADKLQIIAVDDGSRDDTWAWICRAAAEFPGRILTLRQPVNGGKRLALNAGFQRSTGEVLITIDSDSEIEPQTLRLMVSPFRHNPKVGAVAGNVRVSNCQEGLIPRMLDVSFAYSFDFVRASQSMVNTVMCTPGALSAYRRDLVMRVLPEWLEQRFCGRPAGIGEDRAMTNLILREGFHCHFQRDAMVHTKVPTRYAGLCRMFLRWARSNVRETLVMSGFLFRKFRDGGALGARINLLLQWLGMTVGQVFKFVVLAYLLPMGSVMGARMLLGAAIVATAPAALYLVRHRNSNALWAYAYGLFWVVGLSWIGLYALLTCHKNAWLTRQLPAAPAAPLAAASPGQPSASATPGT